MASWDYDDGTWRDSPFDRDMRESERWQRLDDDEERERELLDRLRERGSSLSGRGESLHRPVGNAVDASRTTTPRPESDERKEAA